MFVLYESFPRLTAGLRGCAYYCQCLETVAISLVRTLSNHCCWCLRAFQRNKCCPQIVATKWAAKWIVATASDRGNMVHVLTYTTVFSLGLFSVERTTWFVWCTTGLVPGNPFAPLGSNSNYDIHSVTRLISNWNRPYCKLTRTTWAIFAISSENTNTPPCMVHVLTCTTYIYLGGGSTEVSGVSRLVT